MVNDLNHKSSTYTKQEIYNVLKNAFIEPYGICKFYHMGIDCDKCPFLHSDTISCNLIMLKNMAEKEGY